MGYTIPELPNSSPQLTDLIAISRPTNVPGGGTDYNTALSAVNTLFGGGGGGTSITASTNFPGLFFNYQYYVTQAGGNSTTNNTTAMTTMLAAMNNPTSPSLGGGWAWVLQNNYPINLVSGGFSVADQSWIIGTGFGGSGSFVGGGADQFHFVPGGDGLLFSCTGTHTSGGNLFQGLSMKASSPSLTSTCAIFANQWNIRAQRCNFYSWPVAFFANGLTTGLEACTIQYGKGTNPPAGTGLTTIGANSQQTYPISYGAPGAGLQPTMVILSAPECFAIGPGEYLQNPGKGGGGPDGTIGIGIGGNNMPQPPGGTGVVEHSVISNLHISTFYFGISYTFNAGTINSIPTYAGSAGSKGTTAFGLEIDSWYSCLLMMSPGSNAAIYGEKYHGCIFQKNNQSTDGSAIVYIDATTNGGGQSNVEDIEFSDCTIFSNVKSSGMGAVTPGAYCYGVNIFSGANIRFIGGTISNMGTTSNGSANVALTGTSVGKIKFSNVNMRQSYSNAHSNPSQYAIVISASPNDAIHFSHCNLGGFSAAQVLISATLSGCTVTLDYCDFGSGGGISVTGSIGSGTFYVNNCTGYNDQNTAINTVSNMSTGTAYAAYNQGANSGTSYYGPSLVMFTANSSGGTFQVNGNTAQTLVASQVVSVYLNSPYDTIQFNTHLPSIVLWIGK